MIGRIARRWAGIALLGGVVACAATLPPATPQAAQEAGLPLESLQAGRSLYVGKCSGCHPPYLPEAYSDAQWVGHVRDMRERIRLTADDEASILAYLQATNRPEQPQESGSESALTNGE